MPPRPALRLTHAQQALAEQNVKLAYYVLARYFRHLARDRELYADLAQAAVHGLMLAAARHDPAQLFPLKRQGQPVLNPDGTAVMRPVNFTTFAFLTVHGTILNTLNRDHGWGEYRSLARDDRLGADDATPLPRNDRHVHYSRRPPPRGLPFQFRVESDGRDTQEELLDHRAPPPDESASRADLAAHVASAMRCLDPKDRRMVELYYGLSGEPPKTLDEVARCFAPLTRERVRQRLERAQDRLSKRLGRVADEWFGEPVRKRSA